MQAAQQPSAGEADGHGRGHHQVQVRILQQQHLAQAVRVRELAPGDREAEHGTKTDGGGALHAITASIAKVVPTATATNVPVATKLAGEASAVPQIPFPAVQPRACLAP